MADKKSKENPYQWSDGSWHSITQAEHDKNLKKQEAERTAARTPPPSLYDPNLDAQLRASGRGLTQLIQDIGPDTGVQRVRSQNDYITGEAQLAQTGTRTTQDYLSGVDATERSYGRTLADLLNERARGAQDYGTNIATLQRNYQNLGTSQNEAARKAGAFAGSGAQLQGARKRTANEALDRAPIDTAYRRFTADSAQSEARLSEDKSTALAGLLRGYQRGIEDVSASEQGLSRDYTRQGQDWTTQLQRAQDEARAFGGDILNTKIAQATQAGWVPGQLAQPKKKKPRVVTYTTGVTTP